MNCIECGIWVGMKSRRIYRADLGITVSTMFMASHNTPTGETCGH